MCAVYTTHVRSIWRARTDSYKLHAYACTQSILDTMCVSVFVLCMYVLCWSSRNTAQHSTVHSIHISLFAVTCSSVFFCICSLLFFYSCSSSMCFLSVVWNCMELYFKRTWWLYFKRTAIECICMRTHNSDKLSWWDGRKRKTRRKAIERKRATTTWKQHQKSGTEKRVQFHWHFSIRHNRPVWRTHWKERQFSYNNFKVAFIYNIRI